MTVPIVCETPDCARKGEEINRIFGISDADIDVFYENYRGDEPEDVCPVCGNVGVAHDPEPDEDAGNAA